MKDTGSGSRIATHLVRGDATVTPLGVLDVAAVASFRTTSSC